MQNNSSHILDKAIIYTIKGLVFILPLFFLPWTIDFFDFNKQYLLWIVVPIMALLWFIKILITGEIRLKRTPLDLPILILLAATGLSTLFSLDKFSSVFGFYGLSSNAFLGLVSLVLLYFVLVNFIPLGYRTIFSIIKILLYSYAIVVITALLSIFGFLDWLLNYLKVTSYTFNLIGGSQEYLAIFITAISILFFGLLVLGNDNIFKKRQKILGSIILVFSFLYLVIINFDIAWGGLLVGVLVISFYYFKSRAKENTSKEKIGLAVFILVLVIFFPLPFAKVSLVDLNFDQILINKELPKTPWLDYGYGLAIASQAIFDKPVLGYGPGTYNYVFSLFRPQNLNQSSLWQTRFSQAPSYILEMIISTGILGILSYFLVIGLFFYLAYIFSKPRTTKVQGKRFLIKKEDSLRVSLLAAIVSLVFSQFFYQINTSLLFLFWFFLAVLTIIWRELSVSNTKDRLNLLWPEIKTDIKTLPCFFKIIIISLLLLFSGWLFLLNYEVKYWLADFIFSSSKGKEENIVKAIKLNPYHYHYQIALAKYYLNNAKDASLESLEKRNNEIMRINVDKSIKWARQSMVTAPQAVVTYETLGMIYRDIRPFALGSEPWVPKVFAQALALEPSNPVLVTELGKAYLANNMLEEAAQSFKRALELKNDYYDARFGLAKVYIRDGREKEAGDILDSLAQLVKDPEVLYEQGRLYYNQGEIEAAIIKFKAVLHLVPNHANALYSMGLAMEVLDKGEEALEYFKKVLELNPGNEEVIKKIEKLETRS